MSDGPLVVQSDKTLLLEIDHPLAEECRLAIAGFAELERAPEHIHTYRITPLGLWNARAAGVDAEHVVDVLLRYSRFPPPQALLIDVADTIDRHGRLVLEQDPIHGLVLRARDRAVLEEVVRSKHVVPAARPAPHRRPRLRAGSRARAAQAGAAQGRLAGRRPGRLRRRRQLSGGARRRRRVRPAPVPAQRHRHVPRRWQRRRRAAVRRRQDPRRRRGDGAHVGSDVDPRHQHRGRPAVARRAARPHLAHRRRDRRVLRRAQGDPPGHHRHLPDPHRSVEGRVPPLRRVRCRGLGPDHLRRGAPAAGAGVPHDRRDPEPPPSRADGDARPRGRP